MFFADNEKILYICSMEEIWRDIQGFEGLYQISNLGNVKSLNYNKTGKEQLLVLQIGHDGYRRVALFNKKKGIKNKRFFVHRLVVWAFPEICGEWFDGAVVNHKNETTSDNRAENLEVCQQDYNCNYGTAIERRVRSFKELGKEPYKKRLETLKQNGSSRAEIPVMIKNENEEKYFPNISKASEYLNCPTSMFSNIWTGRLKSIHGYKIKRLDIA